MRYKRNIIIILVSIIIYIVLNIVYNNIFVKSNEIKVFVLKEDISRGNEISGEKLQEIILKNYDLSVNYIQDVSILKDKVNEIDLYKGQILSSDMFIDKSEYICSKEDEEIVSIKIQNSENSSSYKISKDTMVNIYYTGKTEYANEILKNMDSVNVISGGESGYITVKLFDNIEIVDVYDKYGNKIEQGLVKEDSEKLLDTVLINTNSQMAMMIYNLSRYGEFSISVLS